MRRDRHRDRRVRPRRASARPSRCSTRAWPRSPPATSALNAFVHLDEELARAGRRGGRRRRRARRRPGPARRRALRGEGPRGLRRHAHQPRLARLQGPGRRWPPTRSTSPGCAPPAACRSARRPRRSSARSASPRPRRGASPATRGTSSRTPGGSSRRQRGGGRRRPRARSPRPATAAARPASRPAFSGLVGLKPSHGRIPHPGAVRLADRRARACSPPPWPTAPATSTSPPDPTTTTASRSRPPAVRYEELIETLAVAGPARPLVGRPRLRRARRPRGGRHRRGRGRARWSARPGWSSTARTSHLTDPVRTWLSGGAHGPLVLHRRGHVAGRRRRPHPLLARLARGDRRLPGAASIARAIRRREQLTLDAARLFAEVDVLLTPTTAVPAFAAEGPPPGGAHGHAVHDAGQPLLEPVDLGPRRPHRRRPARSASRSPSPATATTSPCAWPGSSSRPSPWPRHAPDPACRLSTVRVRSGSARRRRSTARRRKRSTSSAMVSALGTAPGLVVVALLEAGHVGGGLLVGVDQLAHLALVGRRRDLEVGGGHPGLEHRRRCARSAPARPWATARRARRRAPWPTATPSGARRGARRRGARRRCRWGPRSATAGARGRRPTSGS